MRQNQLCWGNRVGTFHTLLGLPPLKTLQTAIFHHPIAENHLSHEALFQSPRYSTEIMRTRSHSPPTTPTSPLSIRLYLFADVHQGRFCDTERHTFGRLQNAWVPKLSGSTNLQRTAAIAECRVIFDTQPIVMCDGEYLSSSYPPNPPFTIVIWQIKRIWRSCCSRIDGR